MQRANQYGGEDNITVVLVRVKDDLKAKENWQTPWLDLFNPKTRAATKTGN